MISDETHTESEAYKGHDSLATKAMPSNMYPLTQFADAPNDIIMDLWSRFARAHDEGCLPDLIPLKPVPARPVVVRWDGKKDPFAREQEAFPVLQLGFASRRNRVEAAMA